MVGKKKIALVLCGLLVGTSLFGCSSNTVEEKQSSEENKVASNTGDDVYTIGINQIVQHGALDSAREGFIEGLAEKGYVDGDNIKIDYQNAQNDISISQTISQQFVSSKVDMIFAVATPSVQSAYNATKDIPIVFTAVTDPVAAEVAADWKSSGNNITGTSDMVPVDEQLDLLLQLSPEVKTVGVIYNTSEANSLIQVDELKAQAEKLNLEVREISVTNVGEINQNLTAAINDVDALYVPTDNTIASAYELVANICADKGVPMLCAEEAGVDAGGLCAIGIDYFKLGKEAAYKAVEIIEGKAPSDIEITTLSDMSIKINTDTAEKLNITIPANLDEKADKVGGSN